MMVNGKLHAPSHITPRESPMYPLDMRMGEPQSQSRHCGVEKNFLPLLGIKH
jgi:hypothetical protein